MPRRLRPWYWPVNCKPLWMDAAASLLIASCGLLPLSAQAQWPEWANDPTHPYFAPARVADEPGEGKEVPGVDGPAGGGLHGPTFDFGERAPAMTDPDAGQRPAATTAPSDAAPQETPHAGDPTEAADDDAEAEAFGAAADHDGNEDRNEDGDDASAGEGDAAPAAPSPGDEPNVEEITATGHPHAEQLLRIMQQEIVTGLKHRGIENRFQQFQRFLAYQLDNYSAAYTGSELAGNCRLGWYEKLLRNVLEAPVEAERFSRQLHIDLAGDHRGLYRALSSAAEKMDLPRRRPREFAPVASPEEALATIEQAVTRAHVEFAQALATLRKDQIDALAAQLYPVFTGNISWGHTLNDNSTGRWLMDMMELIDRDALHRAAEALVPITSPQLLEQLAKIEDEGHVSVRGVTGRVLRRIDTPAGAILIGGRGKNIYQLDEMMDVAVVIDLGGDDVYYEGTCGLHRPVLVLIDLEGNDQYRGTQPGIQAGAILGVSMLLDVAGDDLYIARDMAQASAIAGVGILIDYAGNDRYQGIRRVQGQAICGLAILLDRGGNDVYRGALLTQGAGGPLGFAVLDDLSGDDFYYTGGLFLDNYKETPGLDGWGQGVGCGIRGVANGGIGILLDGGGDDVYEYDYLAHGGGYWGGVGIARDFAGNDKRLGATRRHFSGGERTEPSFQRFSCGWGCHYTVGFLFDDEGDDWYGGTIMSSGFAWDASAGFLIDFDGNDRYLAAGGNTQGQGAQAGLGVLFDRAGNDVYEGTGQGYAAPDISYHRLPGCGGNFSFLIDHGGNDQYGSGADNNTYLQRGDLGGFLIDRPSPEERQAIEAARAQRARSNPGVR